MRKWHIHIGNEDTKQLYFSQIISPGIGQGLTRLLQFSGVLSSENQVVIILLSTTAK